MSLLENFFVFFSYFCLGTKTQIILRNLDGNTLLGPMSLPKKLVCLHIILLPLNQDSNVFLEISWKYVVRANVTARKLVCLGKDGQRNWIKVRLWLIVGQLGQVFVSSEMYHAVNKHQHHQRYSVRRANVTVRKLVCLGKGSQRNWIKVIL